MARPYLRTLLAQFKSVFVRCLNRRTIAAPHNSRVFDRNIEPFSIVSDMLFVRWVRYTLQFYHWRTPINPRPDINDPGVRGPEKKHSKHIRMKRLKQLSRKQKYQNRIKNNRHILFLNDASRILLFFFFSVPVIRRDFTFYQTVCIRQSIFRRPRLAAIFHLLFNYFVLF